MDGRERMGIYQRFGIPGVINAAGKMTALGGTAQSAAVAAAQAEAARGHVALSALRARAGELVAQRCGAAAASITSGAAAGVAIAIAACVAGSDLDRVRRLPDAGDAPDTVLLQAGHWVHFGAPIEQMVRLGGGRPVLVGSAAAVTDADLAAALATPGGPAERVAALLYVQSHHAVQENRLGLDRCIAACHDRGVPVVVDAAAEEDLRRYVGMGADLVIYSGGKAFGGPTVGFVAGDRELVAACELQTQGIGRPMKVGKEQVLGLLVALEEYERADATAEAERRSRVNATVAGALDGAPGFRVERRTDEAGRPIERVAVTALDGADGARALVEFLEAGEPSIRTRNHHVPEGTVLFDPREMTEEQAAVIAARLRAYPAGRGG